MERLLQFKWLWSVFALLMLITVLFLGLFFYFGPAGFLSPLGPIARLQRTELILATLLVMVAIAPVLIGTPIIMWHYRRQNEQNTYDPQWSFDTKLEVAMWAVPTLVVVLLSVWLAQAVFRIDPYRQIDAEMADGLGIETTGPEQRVDIIGLDWKWLFIYPEEGIASVGEMVVPVHHPIAMRLTTDTVMQSFMAPRLGGQIYTMAGMVTRLHYFADETGEDIARNTQYTGIGRTHQAAPVRVVPDLVYRDWLAGASDAPFLDVDAYAQLARAGSVDEAREHLGIGGEGPILFRLETPELFERVVMRYMGDEPIPPEAQPGSPAYDPAAFRLPDMSILQVHRQTHPNLHTLLE